MNLRRQIPTNSFSHSNLINYARFLCYLLFASRFRRCCRRFRNKMSFKQTQQEDMSQKCVLTFAHTHLLGYSNDTHID